MKVTPALHLLPHEPIITEAEQRALRHHNLLHWAEQLRSGEWTQTQETLKNDGSKRQAEQFDRLPIGYCCLGVLGECLVAQLPDRFCWTLRTANNIDPEDMSLDDACERSAQTTGVLSSTTAGDLAISDGEQQCFAVLNDPPVSLTFAQIADLIEYLAESETTLTALWEYYQLAATHHRPNDEEEESAFSEAVGV